VCAEHFSDESIADGRWWDSYYNCHGRSRMRVERRQQQLLDDADVGRDPIGTRNSHVERCSERRTDIANGHGHDCRQHLHCESGRNAVLVHTVADESDVPGGWRQCDCQCHDSRKLHMDRDWRFVVADHQQWRHAYRSRERRNYSRVKSDDAVEKHDADHRRHEFRRDRAGCNLHIHGHATNGHSKSHRRKRHAECDDPLLLRVDDNVQYVMDFACGSRSRIRYCHLYDWRERRHNSSHGDGHDL